MGRIILTPLFVVFSINFVFSQTAVSPDTVCAGSTEEYKIENPDANSTYTWGIYGNSGTIQKSDNSAIQIKWNNKASIDSVWVFETNQSGCKGDTSTLKVVCLPAPTAKFKEENLCYGQKLQLIFTGTPPFKIEYTLNGNTKILDNINKTKYLLGGESGDYQLIKVYSNSCEGLISSESITNAHIAKPLNKLRIIRKNE